MHQVVWEQERDEHSVAGAVNIDEWWREIDSKILESVIFKSTRLEPVSATKIAPWIPPSCRGTVINTEHLKMSNQVDSSSTPTGCPKMLAEFIRKGTYNPLNLKSASIHELQEVCSLVGIPKRQATTKVYCEYY